MKAAVATGKEISTSKSIDLLSEYEKKIPGIIKYMGSKKSVIDFVVTAINDVYTGGKVYDLFAGTCVVGTSLGKLIPIHSNDIQEYSSILGKTFLSDHDWQQYPDTILEEIIDDASSYVNQVKNDHPDWSFIYSEKMTIKQFSDLEEAQKKLLDYNFGRGSHHLFIKYYSGTYWSFEQCLWIDALRSVAEKYRNTPLFYVILSSIMYMMSYTSQSTGHFAQYRDANNKTSKDDILIYRLKEPLSFFKKKFLELRKYLGRNHQNHSFSSLDYKECLVNMEPNSLVYADPPYAFVHYSRFYHALETLVKYDYPTISHKGRYRSDRHQSPFCRATEVNSAFEELFSLVKQKQAKLVLSYSNTGMISMKEIYNIAKKIFELSYKIEVREFDHIHSTMGRSDEKNKDVKEYLFLITPYGQPN